MTKAANEVHPVAAHLKACSIEEVVIIDDAFDPPTRDSLREEIPTFWAQIERDAEILSELSALGVNDHEDMSDAILQSLLARATEPGKLAEACKTHLFPLTFQKLDPLRALRSHLESIGVKVIQCGSEDDLPENPIRLVFLDYFLGASDDASAVQASTSKAEAVYSRVEAEADKPFIVLMSSKPDVAASMDTFRQASKLLGGLFGFVEKSELRKREELFVHLEVWAIGMPTRHRIQHFVEALESGARAATEEFVRRIRGLGAEDYANIQWLSLNMEGHPLGDYVLWLYKSFFTYIFHDQAKVLEQQRRLDALNFEEFTPCQTPSAQLADIYRCAQTEPGVKDVGPHPWTGDAGTDPLLCTGDMFFSDGLEVFLVINAPCDLTYTPGKKGRPFPVKRSILLMHGQLQKHEEMNTSDGACTELFKHEGKPYRILWDHRRVTSIEYGKVWAWLREHGLVRRSRLALPYAQEIQQKFATQVMRAGMPVRPPSYQYADVEVYCADDSGVASRLGEVIPGGAWIMRRRVEGGDGKEEDLFVLTSACIGRILGRLDEILPRIEARAAALLADLPAESSDPTVKRRRSEIQGKLRGLDTEREKIAQLKKAGPQWTSSARKPHALPSKSQKTEVDKKLLWVYNSGTFEGRYAEGPPIVVNLLNLRHDLAHAADPTGSAHATEAAQAHAGAPGPHTGHTASSTPEVVGDAGNGQPHNGGSA